MSTVYSEGHPWPPPGRDVIPATRRYRRNADGALVLVSESIGDRAAPASVPALATAGGLTLERTPAAGNRVAPPSRPAMNAGGFPAKPSKPTRSRQSDAAVDSIPGLGPSLTRVYLACERLAVDGVLAKPAVADALRIKVLTLEKYVSELRRLGHFPWRWEGVQRNRRRNEPDPVAMEAAGVVPVAPVTRATVRDLVAVCDRTNVEGYVRMDVLCAALKVDAGELDRLIAAAKAQGFAYELMPGSDWIPATVVDRQKGGDA